MSTNRVQKKSLPKTVVLLLLIVLAVIAWKAVPEAKAIPGIGPAPAGYGCETVQWGLYQKRTVCDGARQADGSWERKRTIWQAAGSRPAQCRWMERPYSAAGSHYECTDAYSWPVRFDAEERYIVFDHTVPAGEPGWLPAGTDITR